MDMNVFKHVWALMSEDDRRAASIHVRDVNVYDQALRLDAAMRGQGGCFSILLERWQLFEGRQVAMHNLLDVLQRYDEDAREVRVRQTWQGLTDDVFPQIELLGAGGWPTHEEWPWPKVLLPGSRNPE